MKILIVQVSVGNTQGYAYDIPEVQPLFKKYAMPSVERYCAKHGYDYKLVTEYPTDYDIHYFNKNTKPLDFDYSQGSKNKCATLIRYLHMDTEYDAVVTLDCDVYIPDFAEPLPVITGHMGVEDTGKDWGAYKSQVRCPQNKFINGGVQMVDKETGKMLSDFVKDLIVKKTPPIVVHSDQGYMNKFRSLYPERSKVLNHKWNHMMELHPHDYSSLVPYKGLNFLHYAGGRARTMFINDVKRGLVM